MRAIGIALTVSALALAGCSNEIVGTPVADPAATVAQTPTRIPGTIQIPIPTLPNLPNLPNIPGFPGSPKTTTPGPPPTGLAATTCGDYITMDKAEQEKVIAAIGEDNSLVQMNPELWVGLATAMCSFTAKSTLVKDAVAGQGFR